MTASFVHAIKNGRWVHARDLVPDLDRGLACACKCPDCSRRLVAHLGHKKNWHFQHEVDNANCNPQPMTLLHRFARDSLAARTQLEIPATKSLLSLTAAPAFKAFAASPTRRFQIDRAAVEVRAGMVQPDVTLYCAGLGAVAVEVAVSHRVDEPKRRALENRFSLAAEWDISDLDPMGVTANELEMELKNPTRWRWLVSPEITLTMRQMEMREHYSSHPWTPDTEYFRSPKAHRLVPMKELREARKKLEWAHKEIAQNPELKYASDLSAEILRGLTRPQVVAISCGLLGVDPTLVPVHLVQRTNHGMYRHSHSWQIPLFAWYCIGDRYFNACTAATWASSALPECVHRHGQVREGDLHKATQAAQAFFLQLETQGLLRSDEGPGAERVFLPIFPDADAFRVAVEEQELVPAAEAD